MRNLAYSVACGREYLQLPERMTMERAAALAIRAYGIRARIWNYTDRLHLVDHDSRRKFAVGIGGAGASHEIFGEGETLEDALGAAGLLRDVEGAD